MAERAGRGKTVELSVYRDGVGYAGTGGQQ
jgi:hypothetical protein